MPHGRFAPSPTGPLHLGNLRTAIIAQQLAFTDERGSFLIRMEDLDTMTATKLHAYRQLADLAALGVNSVRPVLFQSERFDLYEPWLAKLVASGQVYECFCSRREIREAASAPHGDFLVYPGTCRDLSPKDADIRRKERPPALRLRSDTSARATGIVDDIVLVRNDGVPSYNLAVVVDDELQGVTQVVRGEDLVAITPSQQYLQRLLGFRELDYVHLPLMVGPDGERMAKRHGDVTLADCLRLGFSASDVRRALLNSLEVGTNGWGPSSSLAEWLRSLL